MQVADNAIDLAAARGVLSRTATLVDQHRAANPTSDGTAEELARCSPRHRRPRAIDSQAFCETLGRFAR